jgi:hypothetical protein
VFGSDLSSGGGARWGRGVTHDLDDVMARAQALVDTPRPEAGYPLAWHVEAMLLGDFPAVAVGRARASDRAGHG